MSQQPLIEFADKLDMLLPGIMREFARRHTCELFRGKITLPQLLIMGIVNDQGQIGMTDAARLMSVSTAAMTGIINRLVRDGYILRIYDSKDRRTIKVKLTAKGTDLVKKINAQRRQMIVKVFSKITELERQDYLRILTKIHDILLKDKDIEGNQLNG